jgi:hypothetical protein
MVPQNTQKVNKSLIIFPSGWMVVMGEIGFRENIVGLSQNLARVSEKL